MKLPISDRLLACAEFVRPGDRVADIGCDHGYLSIHLLINGIARSCIASDINEGPLNSALRNARKYGVSEKITFFLSDGLRNISRDFDTLVCAGMGGDTMVHILEEAPWLKKESYRLVLQCQSKTPMLRTYLNENGWRITKETALRDGRHLYTVMEVVYAPDQPGLETWQCWFPPVLLENPSGDLGEYFRYVREGLRIATAHKEDPEKQAVLEKLDQLALTHPFLKEDIK
jgi:tRNA (adenine22-N1)-methyltransferase